MSTQSIINLKNLPTETAMGQYLAEASVDLLKYFKYEIGCVEHNKLKEMLRLQRIVCGDFCYVDNDQDRQVREAVIRRTITKIYDI